MAVESRIVTMKFDNQTFAQKAQATLDLLARLRNSLDFSKNKKGVQDFQKAADGFNLNGMNTHIQGASAKFLALSAVAITALSNIVNKAIDSGSRIIKALTIEPIMEGFREYETNMNSIQTILANTQAAGTSLDDVNAALQELNHYSDQTIYNFSEMAKNIGTFTAAGVELDTATGAIKGIANLAALSGSNSQQASTAMYQLSQAISAGRVSLQDWNSVVNAGMGGTVFQRALAETAVAMGQLEGSALSLEGPMKNVAIDGKSFRESISAVGGESWLTSDVLTTTLQQFTGDLSDAELAAQGFSAEQIKAIQATAATAKGAATEVKTITQLFGTLKESAGSGWMQSFQILIGDFEQAKVVLTAVNNAIGGIIGRSAEARNALLEGWAAANGRNLLFQGIISGFNSFMAISRVVKGAMSDIFPPVTGERLAQLTGSFKRFMDALTPSADTLIDLSRTFRGVFAIFSIGWSVVKGLGRVIGDLLGNFEGAGGGILDFTGNIGDFLVSIDQAIKNGKGFTDFFVKLSNFLQAPIDLIKKLSSGVIAFFESLGGSSIDAVNDGFGRMAERLNPLVGSMDKLRSVGQVLYDTFVRLGEAIAPLVESMLGEFAGVGDAIADAMGGGGFDKVFDLINTGLLGAITLMVMKFFKGGMNVDIGGGLFSKVGESFDALTGSLTAMQTNVQSKTLMNIAIAVGILAASMVALSLIDSAALTKSLSAMAVGFGQLLGAMAVLIKIGGSAGFIQIPLIATAMVSLATAVLILSGAVAVLSLLSWDQLAVGLAGVAGVMTILVGAAAAMSKFAGPGLIAAAAAMNLMAIALGTMAGVVTIFSLLSWEELGQGLAAVASLLAVVIGAMTLMPPNMIASAVALNLVALAMAALAGVVFLFSMMSVEQIGVGLTSVAAAMAIIAGAMTLMPPNMLIQAAALAVVAFSLGLIADAVGKMGGMTWEEIGKGMVVLAGSLAILAAGLYLMTGAALGALALIIAAGALAIIAPVLVTLGGLSWEEIGKGLVALAGAFVVIGLAGLVLTPLIPSLLGLGAAVLLLGAGAALAGLGILAFATAFTLLTAAGTAGVAILTGMLMAVVNQLPAMAIALANAIVAFSAVISTGGPAFVAAFTTLLMSLLEAVINITPKLGEAIGVLLEEILRILVKYVPMVGDASLQLLVGIINAWTDNIDLVVTAATNLIIAFIDSIAKNGPKLANAAGEALIDFLDGMTAAVERNMGRIKASGERLALAIIDGMTGGLGSGIKKVTDKAKEVAQKALDAAKNLLGIESPSKEFHKIGAWSSEGMAQGLSALAPLVEKSAAGVGNSAMDAIRDSMKYIGDVISSDVDMSPVITPVVDLSQLQKGAGKINTLMGHIPLSADVSLAQARAISADKSADRNLDALSSGSEPSVIKLEQNNYSPEALSTAEIYRRTKNLVAMAETAAGAPTASKLP